MARVNEWIEVAGPSVDIAVAAALQELGLRSRDEVTVEVIREPSKGILGTGWRAQDALVKVTPKPPEPKKRRSRSRKSRSSGESNQRTSKERASSSSRKTDRAGDDGRSGGSKKDSTGAQRRNDKAGDKPTNDGPTKGEDRSARTSSEDGRQRRRESKGGSRATSRGGRSQNTEGREKKPEEASIEEQANVAKEFLTGLLKAFGLEGTVETEIDDDILRINVTGGQTEALVGRKGAIMQAVHEITRTVIQRKTFGAPRMRLDINGYGERRREALRIYSARQAERVLAEGGEIMLEPMNPADRKVVHDAIAEIEGVESYSEGEDPERAVVIATSSDGSSGS